AGHPPTPTRNPSPALGLVATTPPSPRPLVPPPHPTTPRPANITRPESAAAVLGQARFLGYEITVQHADSKLTHGRRSANGAIALRVPRDVITAHCAPYRRHGKPWHRPAMQNLPDYDIVQ